MRSVTARLLGATVVAVAALGVGGPLGADDGRFYPTGDRRIDAVRKVARKRPADTSTARERAEVLLAWARLIVYRAPAARREAETVRGRVAQGLARLDAGEASAAAELAQTVNELFPGFERAWAEASRTPRRAVKTGVRAVDRMRKEAIDEPTDEKNALARAGTCLKWMALIEKALKKPDEETLPVVRRRLDEVIARAGDRDVVAAEDAELVDRAIEVLEEQWRLAAARARGFVPSGSARVDENRTEVLRGVPTSEKNVVPRAVALIEWGKIISSRDGRQTDSLRDALAELERRYETARRSKDYRDLSRLVDDLYPRLEEAWIQAQVR